MKNTIILAALLFSGSLSAKEVVDKVVATINSEIVLLSDVKNMQTRVKKQGSIDETLLLGENPEIIKTDKKAQLAFLIREKLVESEIKRLGMSASEEHINGEFAQMAKKNQMKPEEFEKFLETQGFKPEEYKTILKARFERQTFFEKEIVSKLRITDEDAYGVFQTKYPNYRPRVGEFKIAQIFFANKRGGGTGSLDRATSAFKRLSAGESFESLANQLDETPGSNKDGVLGVFKSGEFLPDIERAIGDLVVNTASGVLRGPDGYHIVKLLDKKTVVDPNFLKVKESIKASLVQQNFERQLKNWFELKKLEASIKIYNDVL